MKLLLSILSFLFFTLSCCHRPKESMYNRSINLDSIPEREFSDLIDEISCIPLKKTSNTFFDCWKLIVHKNYFYIYSLSDFAVFIYSNDGEFVKKIDNRGKGKIETPTDIVINTVKDELWICDSKTKINIYSLNGVFLKSIQPPTECIKMSFADKNTILVYESLFDKNSNYLFRSYTDKWEAKGEFVNKGQMINTSTSYPPSLFAEDLLTNTMYAFLFPKSTIYKWEKGELIPFIYLNSNGHLLTEDKYPNNGFSDEQFADIINENRYTYGIREFQSISNKLFFKTVGGNSMYYFIDCIHDEDCKFSSLFDGFKPQMINPIAGSGDKYLYLVQKKEDLIKHYKDRKCDYEAINAIISSQEELDGVVICIKLKLN